MRDGSAVLGSSGIASNKVEGTAVYDRQGEKLGRVYDVVVGKRSGTAELAVDRLFPVVPEQIKR